jgi:hypothetical protein
MLEGKLADAYFTHAFFAVGFWCEDCPAHMEERSKEPAASDAWCEEVAKQAREEGWKLPRPASDGGLDLFTAWCASCAPRHQHEVLPDGEGW